MRHCVGWFVVLLCAPAVNGDDEPVHELDQLIAGKIDETKLMLVDVEKQLETAQQVAGLFVLEDAQLEMVLLEARATVQVAHEEVKQAMGDAMNEIENMRQMAVGNVTMWQKTLQGLRDATQKNHEILQQIREDRAVITRLETKLDKQKEEKSKEQIGIGMVPEQKGQHEREGRMDMLSGEPIRGQVKLKQMDALDTELEHLRDSEETRVLDTRYSEGAKHRFGGKWLLGRYASAQQYVLEAVIGVYRQLVLPVAVILGLCFVVTIFIGRYKAKQHARRHQRVIYSGYAKVSRSKPKQQKESDINDEADGALPHHPSSRRDANVRTGN
uniref:RxLR effector candidate protein n=1 Tax=Hyaloperonospora arabidopsidis (strain Emoy2) TaxID=559515 RepID=M4BIU7_HYAAE